MFVWFCARAGLRKARVAALMDLWTGCPERVSWVVTQVLAGWLTGSECGLAPLCVLCPRARAGVDRRVSEVVQCIGGGPVNRNR